MKKLLSIMMLCGLFAASNVYAESSSSSSSSSSRQSGAVTTVSQVSNARIGSYITLEGNIVERQRENYFLFRDNTGSIRVEIEDRSWRNRTIDPKARVRIFGEVDRSVSGRDRYISVESITDIR
ncbi:hypothetical protein C9426_09635 [Serratia sp. S1B]|nr:hypothetical protein C9426_09635 [Serratia sp. S1B]